MEIDNPHGDFLITCSHGEEGTESKLIARINDESGVLTEINRGSGTDAVASSFVAENSKNRVAHFACPVCSYDVQLRPDTLREFVLKLRLAGRLHADLADIQWFATRPRKAD